MPKWLPFTREPLVLLRARIDKYETIAIAIPGSTAGLLIGQAMANYLIGIEEVGIKGDPDGNGHLKNREGIPRDAG